MRKYVSVTFVLLAVLLVGDQLVFVGFDLPLPRVAHRRGAPLVGAKRKTRNQAVEILAPTRGTFHGRILRPRQRFELVAAGAASEVVDRHHTPWDHHGEHGWTTTHGVHGL